MKTQRVAHSVLSNGYMRQREREREMGSVTFKRKKNKVEPKARVLKIETTLGKL